MKKNKSFYNLEVAYDHAVSLLSSRKPENISAKSAVPFNREKSYFEFLFLNEPVRVCYPSGEVYHAGEEKASFYLSIILLHYLTTADGTPLSGRWISFKELPGGLIYYPAFQKRALEPLIKAFGNSPDLFVKAGSLLGGIPGENGKKTVTISAFPLVPVTFTIWSGDEEFPPSATILFDENASCYLPTEDYAHLPGIMVREMLKQIS